MCGEYGSKYSRPHYHSLIFGFYPGDAVYYRTSGAGHKVYKSNFLNTVWQLGDVFIGDVTFESASYVARYALKKADEDLPMREIIDVTTGFTTYRTHEYMQRSLKPGIGAGFVAKYGDELFRHDRVVVRGKEQPLPRYYDILLDRISPVYSAQLKAKRVEVADVKFNRLVDAMPDDLKYQDPRRLKVEEVVKRAAIRALKRSD